MVQILSIAIFPADGQPDGEGASPPWFAFDGDFSLVGINNELDDAQAQSATLGLSRQ
jgi:hypothetical protein